MATITATITRPISSPLAAIRARIAAYRSGRAAARLAAEVAAANNGRLTIAMFLGYLGMDPAAIGKNEVQFGKAVAAAYRAAHQGAEPAKNGAALVRGKVFRVNAYRWDELGLLTAVAITYPAVSTLVGA
ncbi:MAG TPA: hypothetical protein VGX23_33665 [Actinocrinis sp.]|nr:hypothetical protein [Actinocrinis sp.]